MIVRVSEVLATIALIVGISSAAAEEAVERSGKIHRGRLVEEKGVWTFRDEQSKSISLEQLSHIRFDGNTTPLPKAPLRWALRLPHNQRVTGNLERVDEKSAAFVTSWGQSVTIAREQLNGIEQAIDGLPIVHDDFETLSKSWRIEGKALLNQDQRFAGKSSLRFDEGGQSATREWLALRDGAIRLFFYDPADTPSLRWTFAILTESAMINRPAW